MKEQVICVTGISAITYYHMRVGGGGGRKMGGGGGGGGGGGSFFSQFFKRIDCFQIAKKNFAVFFRFLPRIIAAIRGHGLEAEKRQNIPVVLHVLYIYFRNNFSPDAILFLPPSNL